MFALPILDTALAFARRMVNRRAVFSPDRHHFHHQMVARGFSIKQTVLVAYGMTLFFVIGGAAIAFLRTRYVVGAYLVIFGYIVVAAYKMGMVHEKPRIITRRPLDGTEMATTQNDMEPSNVIEIRDDQPSERPEGSVTTLAGTWQRPDPIATVNDLIGPDSMD
jgi:hypothetical protein